MATLNLTINRGTTFGPVVITAKDSGGDPVPLAGYKAYAQARKCPDSDVVVDFNATIEDDDSAGIITLPELTPTQTASFPSGWLLWDIILELPSGKILTDPIIEGGVAISKTISKSQ